MSYTLNLKNCTAENIRHELEKVHGMMSNKDTFSVIGYNGNVRKFTKHQLTMLLDGRAYYVHPTVTRA